MFIRDVFPNKMSVPDPDESAHERYVSLFNRLSHGTISAAGNTANKQERLELVPQVVNELNRFCASHYSNKFSFACGYWTDLAIYFGVSLHWIFDLKVPMYCKNQIADCIFVHYSLMQPHEQTVFIRLLSRTMQFKIDQLSEILGGICNE